MWDTIITYRKYVNHNDGSFKYSFIDIFKVLQHSSVVSCMSNNKIKKLKLVWITTPKNSLCTINVIPSVNVNIKQLLETL